MAMRQLGKSLASLSIDPELITQGKRDLPVDGDGDGGELFYCAICKETVTSTLKFSVGSCGHAFCSSCVAQHVVAKLDNNIARVECPQLGCEGGAVELESCHGIIPSGLIDKWGHLLWDWESAVGDSGMYCPYGECSALMFTDGEAIAEAECPHCHRLFCARCAVPWHHGFGCDEFQKLGQDDERGNGGLPVDGDGKLFYCTICMETVPGTLKFSVSSCGHAFCSSCVANYVTAKLEDKIARVECPQPGCKDGVVELESCHGIIPPDLLDKWGDLLCESAVVGAKSLYCPHQECSALVLTEGEDGVAATAEAECPHCHRLFCARCAVPWHDGFGCEEFQKLDPDERDREDLLLRRLAGREEWQGCPKCRMVVEKTEGCNYIKCRCGHSFCYRCASELSAKNHYCNKCKR